VLVRLPVPKLVSWLDGDGSEFTMRDMLARLLEVKVDMSTSFKGANCVVALT